jgi:hypothetical protein
MTTTLKKEEKAKPQHRQARQQFSPLKDDASFNLPFVEGHGK